MFPKLDPVGMAKVKKVSEKISAVITVDHAANSLNIALSSDDPDAQKLVPNLIKQFSNIFAVQLSTFFGIKGKIIDKNK